MQLRLTPIALVLILLTTGLLWSASAVMPPPAVANAVDGAGEGKTQQDGALSTLQRIEGAFARGEIDAQQRLIYLAYALEDFEKLPEAYRGDAPWSGTVATLALQEAVASGLTLDKSTADLIERAVGMEIASGNEATVAVYMSEHFYIEYDEIGGGLSIEDYAAALEQSWQTEVNEFGWAAPPVYTYNPAPEELYPVVIQAAGDPSFIGRVTNGGAYAGFVSDNPNTSWQEADACASMMYLRADYSGYILSGVSLPAEEMLAYAASHELNHAIQFGYGVLTGKDRPDESFIEGGPTWMTNEVFMENGVGNSYLWPDHEICLGAYEGNPYSYWIIFRGLTERYGTGVAGGGEQIMQDYWELTSQSPETNNMLSALDQALANKGSSLADAFHDYAITLRFGRACPVAAPYCFAEADSYIDWAGKIGDTGFVKAAGNEYVGSLEDHYAINSIELPYEGVYDVIFENMSEGGEFRVSMVADLGDELVISSFPSVIRGRETVTVPGYRAPEGTRSVVAVISNQAQTSANPYRCTAHSYRLRIEAVANEQEDIWLPLITR